MQPNNLTPITPRFTLFCLMIGLGMLTACTTPPITDPNASNYVPTAGSKVTVKQRIEVPGGQTRIFLQRGKLITRLSRVDQYWPNCNFEINTLQETPRYIEPGIYTVTRTTRQEREVAFKKSEYIQLASLGSGSALARGDGTALKFEVVTMRLASEQTPDIRELACRGVFTQPVWVSPPTLAEIRDALGEYASISVPEETK